MTLREETPMPSTTRLDPLPLWDGVAPGSEDWTHTERRVEIPGGNDGCVQSCNRIRHAKS